jgi:hypothetical protein
MLVPLLYKSGIQRDGSNFQDEYCIDGQWIRFVGGKIKKMYGQIAIGNPDIARMNYFVIENAQGAYKLFYGTTTNLGCCSLNNNLTAITTNHQILAAPNNNVLWQFTRFINAAGQPAMAFLATNNGNNMLNNVAARLYTRSLIAADNFPATASNIQQAAAQITGGILYSHPFLFLYGENGTVLRSRTNDPINFAGGDSGLISISSEKVIYAANARGGSNSPNILFWTPSSVIYLTNVADLTNVEQPVDFQKEVLSTNSSLMSSRSVVQYDSLFYWLGTDRVFVYNGIVDKVANTANLEYFFNNVDLTKRQLIYGYRLARFSEIRWAYPEKINAGNAAIGCTRELVYNALENSWYDTAIAADYVTVFETTGEAFSYGDGPSNYPYNYANRYLRFWKKETGTTEVRDGGAVTLIPSFFSTPYMGLAAFSPSKDGKSVDKYVVLDRIEPDFPLSPGLPARTNADFIQITVTYKKYAGSNPVTTAPLNYLLTNLPPFNNPSFGKIDLRVQGRFMYITFSSNYAYDVGTILLSFKEGDGQ